VTRKHMTVALCLMTLIGFSFLGWTVGNRSGAHRMSIPSTESRVITMQSPGAAHLESSNRLAVQSVLANCAKGYIRRGSVCEADTTQMALSAASTAGLNSIRPPERQ
jgi:hypothetical protein